MIKFLINYFKTATEQNRAQTKLKTLIPKQKGLLKVKLPKKYIEMIQTLAIYGIKDNKQLIKILGK